MIIQIRLLVWTYQVIEGRVFLGPRHETKDYSSRVVLIKVVKGDGDVKQVVETQGVQLFMSNITERIEVEAH